MKKDCEPNALKHICSGRACYSVTTAVEGTCEKCESFESGGKSSPWICWNFSRAEKLCGGNQRGGGDLLIDKNILPFEYVKTLKT
jgi:hypothetical protein